MERGNETLLAKATKRENSTSERKLLREEREREKGYEDEMLFLYCWYIWICRLFFLWLESFVGLEYNIGFR